MMVTLVMQDDVVSSLHSAAKLDVETGAALLARVVPAPNGDLRLLAHRIIWVPETAYLKRERDQLLIESVGYVPALGEAERAGSMAFWVHTHPGEGGVPLSSPHDVAVDASLADLFRLRTGSEYYGALIVSPRGSSIAFSASLFPSDLPPIKVDRIWQVGGGLRLIGAYDAPTITTPHLFDRNVRAFGSHIQDTLGQLHIGVVGAGGTGSSVAEQLVRLGVRHLTLIDPDVLNESNITRVYGSTPGDVGRPKVDVLRDHLTRIAPDLECKIVRSTVTMEPAARELTSCDVIFGCTDDNAGRLVLSRLATFMLIPVLDVGVLLSSDRNGTLTGIDGRVTVLTPGAGCLICRDRIDVARAAAELRTPEERKRLEDEGYAPALGQAEPAVVAFTTSVAAAAVSELLERLIGYGPDPRPSEILLRWHEREISTNVRTPRLGHYCDPLSGKQGSGLTMPFLEQTWPSP
jgi:hypothetical protein